MTILFNDQEMARLDAARAQCPAGENPTPTGNWVPFYQELLSIVNAKLLASALDLAVSPADFDSLKSAKLWLGVAVGANGETGVHNTFIRGYTVLQGQLRAGHTFSRDEMQYASNDIALRFYNSIKYGGPKGVQVPGVVPRGLPDVKQIAEIDAGSIGEDLYGSSRLGGSAPLVAADDMAIRQNSGWSGTLGFNLMGGTHPYESGRLHSQTSATAGSANAAPVTGSPVDTVDDVKNVLFTVASYSYGFDAVVRAGFSGFTLDSLYAQASILLSNQSSGSLQSVAARTPIVGRVVNTIQEVGQNNFLDMMLGARDGTVRLGRTTNATFVTNARSDFAGLSTSQQQSMSAAVLGTSSDALSTAALSNASARAALSALSVVAVEVSQATADRFQLYNAVLHTGTITQDWIKARAAMTAGMITRLTTVGSEVVPQYLAPSLVAGPVRYYDVTSGAEVLFGSGTRAQVTFGGDGTETLSGSNAKDYFFGGGGADAMNGGLGADYLDMHRHRGLRQTRWRGNTCGHACRRA
jgi:RTX calcium-binding nonapeptide repeat (4 copies)